MIPLGVLAGSRHVPAGGSGLLYRDEVLADSPLVYLRLDDSSGPPVDYGSLGATPTPQNSWPTWGGIGLGDGDSSAGFPASTSVGIGLGTISQIDSSPATLEALINLNSLAASRAMFARSLGGATSARFQVSNTGSLQYLGSPWPALVESSPGVISTATTYHVAATLTGTSCTLYVNGSAVGSGTAGTAGVAGHAWTVGRALASGYEVPFAGNLAGVAIYNTQLTAARILAHAQAAGVA